MNSQYTCKFCGKSFDLFGVFEHGCQRVKISFTNADRIRKMSDERLTLEINNILESMKDPKFSLYEWLQKEVE